ncbi:MAG: tetratricopeptide repeat protein [Muribaculaceae bacterium]|nr:tetratricopeptide repeat protein [Muribaculaceae bacterium]
MKNLVILLAVASFVCAMTVSAASPKDDYDEDPYLILCGEADSAIAREDYPTAAARLREAISIKPHSASNILLMTNLGMVYSMMDSDATALATLDEAIAAYPDMKMARSNRARVLLKMRRDKDAFAEYSEILQLDSLDAESRYYHGLIALYSGNLQTAENDFKVLEQQEAKSIRTARALATLYSLTERNSEAITYYEILISAEDAPEYYAGLAGCLLHLQNLSEASATIAEGLEKYPSDPELYYYRAWLNRDRYRLDDAHADANKAIKLGANPTRVNALFKKK